MLKSKVGVFQYIRKINLILNLDLIYSTYGNNCPYCILSKCLETTVLYLQVRLETDMFVTRLAFDFKIAHCEPK